MFGEKYKRLGFDNPHKLAVWGFLSQEILGLSPWALLTRTSACGEEHVQGYWTSSPTMKAVVVVISYRPSTNMLQKQVTTPTSTVTPLNRLDMVSKVWRAVNGKYALLLGFFLPPSIPSVLDSCLPVNLSGRVGFIPGRLLWQRLKDKVCWRCSELLFALLVPLSICPAFLLWHFA